MIPTRWCPLSAKINILYYEVKERKEERIKDYHNKAFKLNLFLHLDY
jgi:hypothetical protein